MTHDLNKNKICSVLIDRMKFMDKDEWFDKNTEKGIVWMMEAMESNHFLFRLLYVFYLKCVCSITNLIRYVKTYVPLRGVSTSNFQFTKD